MTDTAENFATLCRARALAEVELLANICPGLPASLRRAKEFPIVAQHFENDDTGAIFRALPLAAKFPKTLQRAIVVRNALAVVNLWDGTDMREFLSGSRWGPGSLSVLFNRLRYNADRLTLAATRLIQAIEAQARFADANKGKP